MTVLPLAGLKILARRFLIPQSSELLPLRKNGLESTGSSEWYRLPSWTSSMSGMFDSSLHFAGCLRKSINDQFNRSSAGILMTSGFFSQQTSASVTCNQILSGRRTSLRRFSGGFQRACEVIARLCGGDQRLNRRSQGIHKGFVAWAGFGLSLDRLQTGLQCSRELDAIP